MHEFRRFIQSQCDLRGWKPSELAARSGLSRQHISKMLNDTRSHLRQMPDDKTIEGLAQAFEGVSIQTVRDTAARALGAVDAMDRQTELDLQQVSIDALLTELRRRVESNEQEQESRTEARSQEHGSEGSSSRRSGAPMKPKLRSVTQHAESQDSPNDPPPR